MRLNDELREKHTELAKRCYDERKREAAIRLFCLECQGGNVGEVRRCSATWCPLHHFRMSRGALNRTNDDLESQNDCDAVSEEV